MRFSLAFIFALGATLVSGCVQYDAQSAQALRDGIGPGTLCGELYQARQMKDADSVLAEASRLASAATVDALVSEYARRNPGTNEETLTRLRNGWVGLGMPEQAAICAWDAKLVNHSIGHGQSTKQYRSAGGRSYFFVNGRTGRVIYISA